MSSPGLQSKVIFALMVFSKTFGYAVRGVLFVALASEKQKKVQLDEMAEVLKVPRHFLGKVMKRMAKEGILESMKGPYGGFYLSKNTLKTPLYKIIEITGESENFATCVLKLSKCNCNNPCPLHRKMEEVRTNCREILAATTIGDLLNKEQPEFIQSIATI